jgi:hypothetical protein
MLTTCTRLSRRILLAVAISTGLVLNALPLSVSVANASQTPISSDAPFGTTNAGAQRFLESPGTLTFPSGLTVSMTESGPGLSTRQEQQCFGVKDMRNWYSTAWWDPTTRWPENDYVNSPWTPAPSTGNDVSRTFAEQPVFYSLVYSHDYWVEDCRTPNAHNNNGGWSKVTSANPCPITATRLVEMRCPRATISFTFSSPVTDPILHVNDFGADAWGQGGTWYAWVLSGMQILTVDLANSTYSGTPRLEMLSNAGTNLAVVQDGPDYQLPNSESRFVGAPAITRNERRSVIDSPFRTTSGYGAGSIRFKGTWTTISMKLDLLWLMQTMNSRINAGMGSEEVNEPKHACLLDQLPNSPVYECHLVNGDWVPNTSGPDKYNDVLAIIKSEMGLPEGVTYLWSVDEDFGTAPASYDASDGASHVLSDLRIGSTVLSSGAELADAQGKVNNSGASGIVSPLAGGVDAGDDAFVSAPAIPLSGNYSVTVPINGVSQAAKLCGWVDADASGTFDVNERQCVNVSAGDTSAALTWPESLTGSVTASTWMRLRLSYDLNGVENPTGRVASGEVEDYQIRRASASSPSTSPSSSEVIPQDTPMEAISSGKDKVSELPKTGGTLGMTPMGLAFVLTGALVLKSRTRRSRT